MKDVRTTHLSDFDSMDIIAVDTETLDMETDSLFTQNAEKYTLDIFSVAGRKGNTIYYGAFPNSMFAEFFRKSCWKTWVMHNANYDLKVIRKFGLEWDKLHIEDTMIMYQLLINNKWGYGLKDARVSVLGLERRDGYEDINRFNKEQYYNYASLDALDTYKLYLELYPRLEKEGLQEVYTIERELVKVVSDMEYVGVAMDLEKMLDAKTEIEKKISYISEQLQSIMVGVDFNSPAELQHYFFDVLKIKPSIKHLTPAGKKKLILYEKNNNTNADKDKSYSLDIVSKDDFKLTCRDFSVGVDTLADFLEMDDFGEHISQVETQKIKSTINLLLEYRKYTKTLNTFIDSFIPKLEKGRIHGRFHQLGTDSGRLSSSKPNLQNIPSKPILNGINIRGFFIPSKNRKFITADYSQVELRMVGFISKDPLILEAYRNKEDMHTITSKKFGIERKLSKIINFGVLYGMTADTLQRTLRHEGINVSLEKAQEFIDNFWDTYKKIKGMLEYCQENIRRIGYVRTISGRKRKAHEINNSSIRGLFNTTIQGSSGDLMKVAMVRIWKNIDRKRASILLSVHDEITVESDEDYVDECLKIVKWGMEDIIQKDMLFTSSINTGYSWEESK